MITVRFSTPDDVGAVLALYRRVAALSGGIARKPHEIDEAYIARFLGAAHAGGVGYVAFDGERLVGEIHCYGLGLEIFTHVLGELTVAVDPDFQGRGVGKLLFGALLKQIRENRPEITRVELLTQEGNARGRALYAAMGFVEEGRLQGRVRTPRGIEADVPMAWLRSG
jgi:putative acetyltransferase